MKERFVSTAVSEICRELGLDLTWLSDGYVGVVRDPKTPASWLIYGNDFGLNNSSAARSASDKVATYDILSLSRVPAVKHVLALRPRLAYSWQGLTGMREIVAKIGDDLGGQSRLVVKVRSGSSGGNGVFLISGKRALKKRLRLIWKRERSAAISPYLKISNEYRVIVLDGKVELIYAKELDPDVANLQKKGDGLARHNLSHGARARILKSSSGPSKVNRAQPLLGQLESLAKQGPTALNLRFAAVDIVEVEGELMILEVNSGVMLERLAGQGPEFREVGMDIYRKAILSLVSEGLG